jgi:hypothetical protein
MRIGIIIAASALINEIVAVFAPNGASSGQAKLIGLCPKGADFARKKYGDFWPSYLLQILNYLYPECAIL